MELPRFDSVACALKRREYSLKKKKINRLTSFCRSRNIPEYDSQQPGPAPNEAQLTKEHRRLQLAKWKAEKERKKREELANKKKPFVTGTARRPLYYVPPPPVPKPGPSGPVRSTSQEITTGKAPRATSSSRGAPHPAGPQGVLADGGHAEITTGEAPRATSSSRGAPHPAGPQGVLADGGHAELPETDSVEKFLTQLASEKERLTTQCHIWDNMMEEIPGDVQELVLVAVGQARLLMSQKLRQFADLLERCAHPAPGATRVTLADLRGFRDMVYIQTGGETPSPSLFFPNIDARSIANEADRCNTQITLGFN